MTDDLIADAKAEIARRLGEFDAWEVVSARAMIEADVWERTARSLAAEVGRLRERLAEETAYAGTMTGVASQRASEIAGLHTEVERLRRRLDSQRSQIAMQAGRDAVVRIERDDARRELAEVTKRLDALRAGVAEVRSRVTKAAPWANGSELATWVTEDLTALLDQAGGQPDQTATETGPSATHSHEKADTGIADGGDTPQAHKAAQTDAP